jgi:hypothetical protein
MNCIKNWFSNKFNKKVKTKERVKVEWFLVEDKMPPPNKPVRIGIENGNVPYASTGIHVDGVWIGIADDPVESCGVNVTNWRELLATDQQYNGKYAI